MPQAYESVTWLTQMFPPLRNRISLDSPQELLQSPVWIQEPCWLWWVVCVPGKGTEHWDQMWPLASHCPASLWRHSEVSPSPPYSAQDSPSGEAHLPPVCRRRGDWMEGEDLVFLHLLSFSHQHFFSSQILVAVCFIAPHSVLKSVTNWFNSFWSFWGTVLDF